MNPITTELTNMAAHLRELFPETKNFNLTVSDDDVDVSFHEVESYETGTKMLQRAGANVVTKEIGGERRVILEGQSGGVTFAVFVRREVKRGAA